MDLRAFGRSLRRSWWLLLLVTLFAVAVAAAMSLLQSPRYEATAKVFVATGAASVSDLTQGSVFTTAAVKSYADLATTPYVLDPVIKKLGLKTSSEALADSITASAPLDTALVEIDVRDTDATSAANIANAVSESLTSVVSTLTPDSSQSAAVRVTRVQPALPPTSPTSPNIPLNVALSALLGLAVAVVAVSIRSRIDNRIHNAVELKQLTTAPVIGSVANDSDAAANPLASSSNTGGRAEAFKTIRTNLQFLDLHPSGGSITITSSVEGEGKSTTAVNLAVAVSALGSRVLLVDADLRRPKAAAYLGLDSAIGLTDVCIGRTPVSEAFQSWGDGALQVLPAGSIPPNPSEILASSKMRELVQDLRSRFDLIIFDAPPLLAVTDAAIVSSMTDGVLLVCALGSTRRPQLEAALLMIENVRSRVFGLILNKVPVAESNQYGYGYGYGYSTQSTTLSRG